MKEDFRPYLVEAVFNYCVDHDKLMYVIVKDDLRCSIPQHILKKGKVTLSLSLSACPDLQFSKKDNLVSFNTRFSGKSEYVYFPYDCIIQVQDKEGEQRLVLDYIPPEEVQTSRPAVGKPTLSIV